MRAFDSLLGALICVVGVAVMVGTPRG